MKIMLMSGYPGEPLRREGSLDEDMAYLEKPFTPRALAEKVNKAIAS